MQFSIGKPLLAVALLLLLVASVNAYSDYSFEVKVKVNDDGSAHVTEKTVLLFDNDLERGQFDSFLNSGENSILEWKRFSKNIRYHLNGEVVKLSSTKITARREYSVGFQAGSVIIDYDVEPTLFVKERISSRVTRFSLNPAYLTFDLSKNKETVLGNGMQLRFILPGDALFVSFAPSPDSMANNEAVWHGPVVGTWKLVFEREKPLSDEVSQFFFDFYERMLEFIPVLLLLGAIAFVVVKLWKSKNE